MIKKVEPNSEKSSQTNFADTIPKITVDKTFAGDSLGAAVTIDTAFVINDILEIHVKYSGGCKEHEFKLFSQKQYMKSMPPQLKIFLFHNNNNDNCRGLLNRILLYNITEIKYESQNELLLLLNDYSEKIEYLYNPK